MDLGFRTHTSFLLVDNIPCINNLQAFGQDAFIK